MDKDSRHLELNLAKWNHWARSLDKMSFRTKYLKKAQKDVLSLLNIRGGVRFLDVGCGPGWAVEEAANLAGGKGEFYGIDLSPLMIEKARRITPVARTSTSSRPTPSQSPLKARPLISSSAPIPSITTFIPRERWRSFTAC